MTTLRPMAWPDIPALAAADAQLFGSDAWTEASWWAELAGRPRREYVVAEDETGRIAGYGGLDHGGAVADVMTVAVRPDCRGTGLGRRLLGDLIDRAAAGGAESLMLEVRADNDPARRLYQSAGFAVVDVRRRYYQPDDVDALVLRRRLP
jgi:ribosomal-protein-alanine N-acetyltransferase